MPDKLVVYGHEACPEVAPVRDLLDRAGVDYRYVSTTLDRNARRRVREINQGNASVPTLLFPDGSTLTEPPLARLQARLEAEGYTVAPPTTWQRVLLVLQAPSILMFGLVFLALGLTSGQHTLSVAGGVLLAAAGAGRLPRALSRARR